MGTILYTHADCFGHDPGRMHPEHPARLKAVLTALSADEFSGLDRREAPKATVDQVARAHPRDYVDAILEAVPETGERSIDGDTIMSPGTGDAILRCAGAVCAAVDAVLGGEAENAFCAMRPPGHHAEPRTPMGFCFFNQIAVGAEHARTVHGLRRVAIVDFDVHHGNGTQGIFYERGDVLTVSLHGDPATYYPFFTGFANETGEGDGAGCNVNYPLPQGTGDDAYMDVLADALESVAAFKPDVLVVALGLDASEADPLAFCKVTTEGFRRMGRTISEAGYPSLLVQEGGYISDQLGDNLAAFLDGFEGVRG